MKMVNPALLAIFLSLSACSGKTVSERDEAIAAINAGNLDGARIHLKLALQAAPTDAELHFLNGKVAVETGNYELAKTEFQPLLANPKFANEARALLAQAYLATGNAQIALETLGTEPFASGAAYGIAADANLALGRADRASQLVAKGLAAFPQSSPLLQVDAQYAISSGDVARARGDVKQALALTPNDVHAVLLAGRLSLLDGDKAQAERHFDKALKMNAGNPVALLAKAALAHERGDQAATRELLDSAAKSGGSGSLLTQGFMAQMAIEAGDLNRANKIIDAVPGSANMPYLSMLRGVIASGRGQDEQAISLLVPFFQHGGENPAARVALANSLVKTGQQPQAWRTLKPLADAANAPAPVLQMAVQLTAGLNLPEANGYRARLASAGQPDPIAKEMGAADTAIAKGDWAGADRIYQRVLAANPASNSIILFNNAALARLKAGDKAKAVELARRASALAPEDPIVNDTLGWALFNAQGPTPEVIALMRKAYAAQPSNPEIQAHIAQIGHAARPNG